MISLDAAQEAILRACAPVGTELVELRGAVGRVLAHALRADADLVPFARSAMDGFAVRSVDVASGGDLPVREHVYAGRSQPLVHEAHTATAIATGAPIPRGADAVVPIESVVRNNGTIHLAGAVAPGTHIFPPGEDARAGDELLPAGRRLRAADLGLLAASGNARVAVVRRPTAIVVTTGDEVVEPTEMPAHGQIRNSNSVVVAATLAGWGCDVAQCVHVADDGEALGDVLADLLERCDILVTAGGASVGERDLVKPALRRLGCTFTFESVALRPAKPTAFATRGSARICVLPGNPSSAFVALHEFARPAALRLAGRADTLLSRVSAELEGGHVHGKAERSYACYAMLRATDAGFAVTPLDNQCSALTRTASSAAGFIVVPPGRREYLPGDRVWVDVVDWSAVAAISLPREASPQRAT
jgi:molybdopterin molybdotransferase